MAFLGQEELLRIYQERFKYLYLILSISLILIVSRLVYLQIFNGDVMRQYSDDNRIKKVTIEAPRGMIFDRNRTLLVDNQPSFDLEIVPQYLRESQNKKEVLKKLSQFSGISVKEIAKKLKLARTLPAFLPVKIKEGLTKDEVARIETWKLDMPGVSVKMEIKRTSLYKDVASHLLGYIGKANTRELKELRETDESYSLDESVGKFGIEKQLEPILRGQDGQEILEVDALGRRVRQRKKQNVLSQDWDKPAIPGKNLILTIDQDVQLAAYDALGDQVGAVVAIDPNNGEILAMLSKPSFDPTVFSRGIPTKLWNELLNNENRPLGDKTIQDHYPPGSTFKVVTAFAAIAEKLLNTSTHVNCTGSMRVGNRTYHCWKKGGHGNVNLTEAIEKSCDVFFWKLAQKFESVDQIAKWAFKLGLGHKTDIELPREVPGLIPTVEWKKKRYNQIWNQGEVLSVAIGQSFVDATIIQLANLYATIANGGTVYKPHYLRQIENPDGSIVSKNDSEVVSQLEIDKKALNQIQMGLQKVVNGEDGTAKWNKIPGLEFSGKTGTSQVIRLSADKIYQRCQDMKYEFRHHGLFAGYAPSVNPVIAVAVIVEHGCSGSGAAAPVAKKVIQTYIQKHFPELIKKPKPTKPPVETALNVH